MSDEQDEAEMIADLLSIISHDVKNGLNVINLGVHQLTSLKGIDPEGAARMKRVSEMLTRASKRMSELMRDVVDLARIDSNALVLEPRTLDVKHAIRDAIESQRREAEERKLTIEVTAADGIHAFADPERTANIIAILLSNAIRVAPENSTIRIVASAIEGAAQVEVHDKGPGLGTSTPETLFVRRRPKRGQKNSLGRGLPLAFGVLKAQGGDLRCHSEPGKGTTFTFTLPLPPKT
jgi:signal transduction histidine kinase